MLDKATIHWILVSHPLPAQKLHPPEFGHYAIIPFCTCAKCYPNHFRAGSAAETRVCAALLHSLSLMPTRLGVS